MVLYGREVVEIREPSRLMWSGSSSSSSLAVDFDRASFFSKERQEELDKLLHKTRIVVHTSAGQQQGPCSSKLPNTSGASSPSKHGRDCLQSNSSNLFAKMKGKKRDREDPSFEPIKRGRNVSGDVGDMEIARVFENGGLADSEAVAKLVRLMKPEKSQRKIDLAGRSMLAGIIAATEKLDYLRQFIQLKGLVVLDEWLQEIHKGKFGESRNIKDNDKSVENFILVLLCALFKLPVNLNALQMCNIGKSVNYLRSHKNSEIQKKARTLVDTWKKRVEAEMSVNDAKSGSNQAVSSPGRSRDASHGIGGYRHSGQSSEVAIRSLVAHNSSLKSSSAKHCQEESNLKSGSMYPCNARSPLPQVTTIINGKGVQPKICIYGASSELPQSMEKEEKTVGVHKETALNRSELVEKASHKAIDGFVNTGNVHDGNNHKLIVKIPNRVRIPAQSIVSPSVDDSPCRNNTVSSPVLPERHAKSDVCLRKSDDGGGSPAAEQPQTNDIRNGLQLKKTYKSSVSLMNALIEICVEFLEADVTMSADDEIGINLLASVAIGEFSGIALPAVSSHRPPATAVSSSANSNGDKKHLHGGDDCNSSSVLKINDEESVQHLDIIHKGLNRKEESSLRNNRLSDEHLTIPCTTGRSVTVLSSEVHNEKGVYMKDESRDQLPAACESVTIHREVTSKVKDASLYDKSELKARMDTTLPLIIKDDIVKTEEPKITTLIEQNSHSVSFKSESRVTDKMSTTCSRTSRHLDSVNTTTNVVKTASVELSDYADEVGEGRVVRENGSSQILAKQEDLGSHGTDMSFMNTFCKDKELDKKEALGLQSRGSAPQMCSSAAVLDENSCSSTKEEKCQGERTEYSETMAVNALSLPTKGGLDAVAKHAFDLNEDVNMDEGIYAEPTKFMELPLCPSEVPHPDGATFKQAHPPLDIDLNVADENFDPEPNSEHNFVCEMVTASLRSSGGLNLDLNKIEGTEMVQQPNSNAIRIDVSVPTTVNALPSSIITNGKASNRRDFDLNDGPTLEEMAVDKTSYSQPACNNIPLHSSFGPRYYNSDAGNLSAWNPPRTSYVSPSALPGREAFPVVGMGGGSHRIIGGSSSSVLFYPDTYRESVLSSFPAVPFQSAPFQYPVFPFGSSFPLHTASLPVGSSGYMDPAASGRISAFPSQLGGNAPSVSFQYPYVVSRSIPDVNYNGVFDRNQHEGKQCLDLNSSPGGVDLEGIDRSMPTVSRQVSAVSSQPLVDEQVMMYHMAGGIPKRKEPDGGSSMDKLNFNHSSWWR